MQVLAHDWTYTSPTAEQDQPQHKAIHSKQKAIWELDANSAHVVTNHHNNNDDCNNNSYEDYMGAKCQQVINNLRGRK